MKTLYERNTDKFHELLPESWWAAEMWHSSCVALGRPFTVSEAYRTTERQKSLYAQGRTKPGPIVTERDGVNRVSDHQLRLAVDIYPNCPKHLQAGWYQDIEDVAKNYGIAHPYTKGRFIDLPHFIFRNAKHRPAPRTPATPQEAMRKLQRELRASKPGRAYNRILERIEQIRSKQ